MKQVREPIPGWTTLVNAGAVTPPSEVTVGRAMRAVRFAAAREQQPVVSGRRRSRLAIVSAVASIAAVAVAASVLASRDGSPSTDDLTVVAGADGPILTTNDPEYCMMGEARVGKPATTVDRLGFLASDPSFALDSLLVREERRNCPAYSPTLELKQVGEDGQVQRYANVYGPLPAAPWETNDADAAVSTTALITETKIGGRRAQFIALSPAAARAVWTDAQGNGWAAYVGGISRIELVEVIEGLNLGPAGARVDGESLGGMIATEYPAVVPSAGWDTYWATEYRSSSGSTVSVEVFEGGPAEGTVGWSFPTDQIRQIPLRETKAQIVTLPLTPNRVAVTAIWYEGSDTWIRVSSESLPLERLIQFAESLDDVNVGDPRLAIAR